MDNCLKKYLSSVYIEGKLVQVVVKEEAYFRKHKQVISNTYEVKKETMNEFKMEIKNDFLSTYYEI